MTCAEFIAIWNRGPTKATRAEYMAVDGHLEQCVECKAKIAGIIKANEVTMRERLGDGYDEYMKNIQKRADEKTAACKTDPECNH